MLDGQFDELVATRRELQRLELKAATYEGSYEAAERRIAELEAAAEEWRKLFLFVSEQQGNMCCEKCAQWEAPQPPGNFVLKTVSGWCPVHGEHKEPEQFCSEWESGQ